MNFPHVQALRFVVVLLAIASPRLAGADHLMITPATCEPSWGYNGTEGVDYSVSASNGAFGYGSGTTTSQKYLICNISPMSSGWNSMTITGTRSAAGSIVEVEVHKVSRTSNYATLVREVRRDAGVTGSFDTFGNDDNGASAGEFTETWDWANYYYYVAVMIDRTGSSDAATLWSIRLESK